MRNLSPHEVETLRRFENAAMLRDLNGTSGWIVYKELAASKIQCLRDEYENLDLDRDATWKAKIALQAVREFHQCMMELVEQARDILEPEAMKRMIEQAKNPDPASYDGELMAWKHDEI